MGRTKIVAAKIPKAPAPVNPPNTRNLLEDDGTSDAGAKPVYTPIIFVTN